MQNLHYPQLGIYNNYGSNWAVLGTILGSDLASSINITDSVFLNSGGCMDAERQGQHRRLVTKPVHGTLLRRLLETLGDQCDPLVIPLSRFPIKREPLLPWFLYQQTSTTSTVVAVESNLQP